MKHLAALWKSDKLSAALLLSWYLTIISIYGDTYLLNIPMPIGGHFFLFRGALPLTVLLFGIRCLRDRKNPFAHLTLLEKAVVLAFGVMVLYGSVSLLFAISKGAWFTKYSTMVLYFCFTLLAIFLLRDTAVLRSTVVLSLACGMVCSLGGLAEMFHGVFFDTPYSDFQYYFYHHWLQPPIFTFYNTNGFTVVMFWTLLIGWMYLFRSWPELTQRWRVCFLWAISGLTGLNLVLYFAANGRLTIYALPLLFAGLAIWLLMRYRRGMAAFLLFLSVFAFIYVGENFDYTKSYLNYTAEKLQYRWEQLFAPKGTPKDWVSEKPEFEVNNHGTMSWLVPTDGETGNVSISSDESGGVRMLLLKASLDMLLKSKGLGIGLGNAELRMVEYDNPEHAVMVHCFIMELFLEFGIFAIIPLGLVACALLWHWLQVLLAAVRRKDWVLLSDLLFQVCAVATYPLLSTANSSSWGIGVMWLFLAYIVADCRDKQSLLTADRLKEVV